jgi:hypothetical protein
MFNLDDVRRFVAELEVPFVPPLIDWRVMATSNDGSPCYFVSMVIHIEDGKPRPLRYHRPIKCATAKIPDTCFFVYRKPAAKLCHSPLAKAFKDRTVKIMDIHKWNFTAS